MGYTHYWRRTQELPADAFALFVEDFRLVHEASRERIPLAGPGGDGEPVIRPDSVRFNGVEDCGHPHRNLGIAWPSEGAGGVAAGEDTAEGTWFAGASLGSRTCGGDCSHEGFDLPRVFEPYAWEKDEDPPADGLYFDCTKTAYKPYDVLVTAALVIAKHRFGDAIAVTSDGGDADWFDAEMLCHQVLGYGLEFVPGK